MFETISYESILNGMLEKVPNTIDKREGSIIYDALAPAAMELMRVYLELNTVINETFADTASREYLIRRALERGLSPYNATFAILKASFNIDVPIGSRFNISNINYTAFEKIDDFNYKIRAETSGVLGNRNFGTLVPIDYIEGLETAEIIELLIPAEDDEDTEVFRQRYLNSFQTQAFGGNKADYIEKTNSIDGVGGTKVYPIWNGGGTVKLVITNSSHEVPSSELLSLVSDTIDPVTSGGLGDGLAPIGHVVTVVAATAFNMDISAQFSFTNGFNFESALPSIRDAINSYFQELNSDWQNLQNIVVRISQIENRILDLPAILDVSKTTINGSAENVILGVDEICSLGVISNV